MKRILAVFIFLLFITVPLSADEVTKIITVTGYGMSHTHAVQNGLIEAVKQLNGVSINSKKTFAKKIQRESVSKNGKNSGKIAIGAQNQSYVKEATSGLINGYKIVESRQKDKNDWVVKLSVKIKRYKTPGISPHSRRKIAVIPFSTTNGAYYFLGGQTASSEISRQFTQKLVTEITQTRKFSVFDREYIHTFLQERNLVLSPDAKRSEQMKIGEVLGVDYLLAGKISKAGLKRIPYTIEVTGETGYNYMASFNVDYRIMVMATRQIKWSDTVALSLTDAEIRKTAPALNGDQIQQALLTIAAKQVIHKAMENIYPVMVVQVQPNQEIVLNQGGVTLAKGDQLNVFSRGEKVVDAYTGESLGAAESWIARIEIVRVIPKMSYARVIKGDVSAVKKGSICRRVAGKGKNSENEAPGSETDIKSTANGGVVLPFD